MHAYLWDLPMEQPSVLKLQSWLEDPRAWQPDIENNKRSFTKNINSTAYHVTFFALLSEISMSNVGNWNWAPNFSLIGFGFKEKKYARKNLLPKDYWRAEYLHTHYISVRHRRIVWLEAKYSTFSGTGQAIIWRAKFS